MEVGERRSTRGVIAATPSAYLRFDPTRALQSLSGAPRPARASSIRRPGDEAIATGDTIPAYVAGHAALLCAKFAKLNDRIDDAEVVWLTLREAISRLTSSARGHYEGVRALALEVVHTDGSVCEPLNTSGVHPPRRHPNPALLVMMW